MDLTAQLQNERDARALQEGLYKEQIKCVITMLSIPQYNLSKFSSFPPRMFQALQEESSRTQQQKSEVLSQLQVMDSSKQGLEERLTEMQRTNAQLQVPLPCQ